MNARRLALVIVSAALAVTLASAAQSRPAAPAQWFLVSLDVRVDDSLVYSRGDVRDGCTRRIRGRSERSVHVQSRRPALLAIRGARTARVVVSTFAGIVHIRPGGVETEDDCAGPTRRPCGVVRTRRIAGARVLVSRSRGRVELGGLRHALLERRLAVCGIDVVSSAPPPGLGSRAVREATLRNPTAEIVTVRHSSRASRPVSVERGEASFSRRIRWTLTLTRVSR